MLCSSGNRYSGPEEIWSFVQLPWNPSLSPKPSGGEEGIPWSWGERVLSVSGAKSPQEPVSPPLWSILVPDHIS